jgi:hypothetical protein
MQFLTQHPMTTQKCRTYPIAWDLEARTEERDRRLNNAIKRDAWSEGVTAIFHQERGGQRGPQPPF